MGEENKFSYDSWKEYLKTDKNMNEKWKFLISLWENVSEEIKEVLESLPKREAMKRRRELTAKNIFNVINTAKQKPNFRWQRKMIWNEWDERYEYVIQCLNPSSDYIFRKIKEERGVVSMHWESINKYLQPVADKIWILKTALRTSVKPEVAKWDLSYESMRTNISEDDEGEVDPDYPKGTEWWKDPVVQWSEEPKLPDDNADISMVGEKKGEEDTSWEKKEGEQLTLPFEFDD